MNYIFLDVDGVLNTWGFGKNNRVLDNNKRGALLVIDDTLVNNLKNIYRTVPKIRIVLSSTWRTDTKSLKAITQVLREKGMKIYDRTPNFHQPGIDFGKTRRMEILHWVENNMNVNDNFVAIDDVPLGLGSDHFVKTDETKGLTVAKSNRVKALLL